MILFQYTLLLQRINKFVFQIGLYRGEYACRLHETTTRREPFGQAFDAFWRGLKAFQRITPTQTTPIATPAYVRYSLYSSTLA